MKTLIYLLRKNAGKAVCAIFILQFSIFAQNNRSYFEQSGSTIAIEAEDGLGYGWEAYSEADASAGQVLVFPKVDTLYFPAIADAYIDRYNPNTNYGTLPTLEVDGKGGMNRGFFILPWGATNLVAFEKAAFLKFDVSGLSQPIVEARVFMYCLSGSFGGGIYELDPNMDDMNWSETQATWNNKPSKHYDGNTFQDFLNAIVPNNWYAFDVTQALSGKMDGTYSFGLVMQEDQPTTWSSREGTFAPYLMVLVRRAGVEVAGNVGYYDSNNPIPGVRLAVTGSVNISQISNGSGDYAFLGLEKGGSYLVTPYKETDSDVGPLDITTYDAALTAQAAVGLRVLTSNQNIAADVSKDDVLSTYDAALIARYAVGLSKLPDSHVGEWFFSPASRSYTNLILDKLDENFTGILLGNVHGGWQMSLIGQRQLAKAEKIQLPDFLVKPNGKFELPINMTGETGIISLDCELTYDSTMVRFDGLSMTAKDEHLEVFYNNTDGKLRIGVYSIKPFEKNSELIRLRFRVIGKKYRESIISMNRFQLNGSRLYRGQFSVRLANSGDLPETYHLSQSFPNPFLIGSSGKNFTRIDYQIPNSMHVSLEIYNQLGQLVKRLVDKDQTPGRHSVFWDGRNSSGELVTTGIYFYRLKTHNFHSLKRIVVLH